MADLWRALSSWPALIFWPAIIGGLLVAVIGVARRRVSLLIWRSRFAEFFNSLLHWFP